MQLYRYRPTDVRERVSMPLLCDRLGILLNQEGSQWTGLCPFHVEHTPRFLVRRDEEKDWHFHCAGCGARGDIFELWMRRQGGDYENAVKALYGVAGFGPVPYGWPSPSMEKRPSTSCAARERTTDALLAPGDAACRELAALREVDVAAVKAARDAGLVWSARLGVCARNGLVWGEAGGGKRGALRLAPVRAWAVADGSGMAMQVFRCDGVPWPHLRTPNPGEWTIGTANWPVGANLIREKRCVVLVHGGVDLLAVYDFLHKAGRLDSVAVVGVLEARARLHPDALRFFRNKRVCIFVHVNPKDPETGRRAGWEAAARWHGELTAAGAEVDGGDFSLIQTVLAKMEPSLPFNPSPGGPLV